MEYVRKYYTAEGKRRGYRGKMLSEYVDAAIQWWRTH